MGAGRSARRRGTTSAPSLQVVFPSMPLLRAYRRVAAVALVAFTATLLTPPQRVAAAPEPPAPSVIKPITASKALARLRAGKQRYVSGQVQGLRRLRDRPLELDGAPYPMAVVVAYSLRRLPGRPPLAFDQAWGNRLVTRLAGNVVDPMVLASAKYAVTGLHTKLIVVARA